MTITTDEPAYRRYVGDGATSAFQVPFRFDDDGAIAAILTDTAGNETAWSLNVNYSLVGAGAEHGGTLTSNEPVPYGYVLYIDRATPLTQQADYVANDDFPEESHERALDKLTMIVQDQRTVMSRVVTVPRGESGQGLVLPPKAQRVGKFAGFAADGAILALSGTGNDAALRTDLALPNAGLRLTAFTQDGLGAIARTGDAKMREQPISSTDFDGSAQAMLDEHRTSLRPLRLTAGLEVLPAGAAGVVIDMHSPEAIDTVLELSGTGWREGSPAGSSGFDGTSITGTIVSLDRVAPSADNNDAFYVLSNFAIFGSVTATPTAGGTQIGLGGSVNNARIRDLYVGFTNHDGLQLTDAYCTHVTGGLYFGNWHGGIAIANAFNNAKIEGLRAYGNGLSYTTQDQGNLLISGARVNYAPAIRDVDVSYSGKVGWSYALGNLVSVKVVANVCTVITSTAHGLATGNFVGVRCTAFNTVSNLSSQFGYVITVINATKFTFATGGVVDTDFTAVNYPYLSIGTSSIGMALGACEGATVENFYCEDPTGPAAYIGANKALTLTGGFVLNGDIIIDSNNEGVEIGGFKFNGDSRLVTAEANHRATTNVKTTVVFDGNGKWVHGDWFMRDGQRFGPGGQPLNGPWQMGELCWTAGAGGAGGVKGGVAGWMRANDANAFLEVGILGQKQGIAVIDPLSDVINYAAGSTPTAGEYNKLVDEIYALRASLGALLTSLRVGNTIAT